MVELNFNHSWKTINGQKNKLTEAAKINVDISFVLSLSLSLDTEISYWLISGNSVVLQVYFDCAFTHVRCSRLLGSLNRMLLFYQIPKNLSHIGIYEPLILFYLGVKYRSNNISNKRILIASTCVHLGLAWLPSTKLSFLFAYMFDIYKAIEQK